LVAALEEDGMSLHLETEVTDLERHGKAGR
jgi:hypothetical protein